jgi:hypothetical protein
MNKTTKLEKSIKDINVKELKANFRTWLVLAIFASLIAGWVGSYFVTHLQIREANQQAVSVVNSVSASKQ